MYMRNRTVK